MRALTRRGAVFLDRDGTINVGATHGSYIEAPDEVRLLPRAAAGIRKLNDAGLEVIVVTNQRGIALGRMSEADLTAIHRRMSDLIASEAGAVINDYLYCPHDEGMCGCRKPNPGLLLQAAAARPWLDLESSVMVGDTHTDIEAGRAAGTQTIQLGVEAVDLHVAVDRILSSFSAP